MSGHPRILSLESDDKTCLKAVMFRDSFSLWGVKSAQEVGKLYRGKTVFVSGIVTEFNELPQSCCRCRRSWSC